MLSALKAAGAVHARGKACVVLLRSLLALIAVVLLILLADMIVHFSDTGRWWTSLVLVTAGIGAFLMALWVMLFHRPSYDRVARMLEERNPELGSKLINILRLEADTEKASTSDLTRQLARYAVKQASQDIQVKALPPLAREPRLKQHFGKTAAACVGLLLVTLLGGHIARNQWLRLLDPYGDHPPFSLTILSIEEPVDQFTVVYDHDLIVKVKAGGHLPREVFLTMTPEDPAHPAVTLDMLPQEEGSFVCRLEHLLHPCTLTAHTGDHSSRSKKCRIQIQLTPQFTKSQLTLAYPAYTGMKPRTTDFSFRPIQVLQGTTLQWQIGSNRPLGKGKIHYQTSEAQPVAEHALAPAEGQDPRTAFATFAAQETGKLAFFLVDETGIAAQETPESAITVTKDLPPVISVSKPERDALVVENHKVEVLIDARDDYGVAKTRLHVAINGKFLPTKEFVHDVPGEKSSRHQEVLDLTALGVKSGDEITLFAETMDYRPEAQIARTTIRKLTAVSDEEYKEMLRQNADVAAAAGKYEQLFRQLDRAVQRQRQIEKKLEEIKANAAKNPDDPKLNEQLALAVREQHELNQDLEQLAREMKAMKRQNPVYDFENELAETLGKIAGDIESSIEKNAEDVEKALEKSEPDQAPQAQTLDDFAQAAKEQAERLDQSGKEAEEQGKQPLEDLAKMHELMKDFAQFQQLLEQQKNLSQQSKAYDKENLTEDDKQALADIGAKQREMAPKLQQLAEKLERDAEAAKELAPEAAEQAQEMAEQLKDGALPQLAREAASQMMKGDGENGHEKADNLLQEMQKMLGEDNGQQQMAEMKNGLEKLIQKHGMKPGDNFRQMMMSRLFRGKPMPGMTPTPGMPSFSSPGEQPPMLLGGESMSDSDIASAVSGEGDNGSSGQGSGPTAKLDHAATAEEHELFSRRTDTANGTSMMSQYESLADAYFRKLTTPPSNPETKSP